MTEKTSPRPPVSVLIGRQLDQEKIDVLSKRVQVIIFPLPDSYSSAKPSITSPHLVIDTDQQ